MGKYLDKPTERVDVSSDMSLDALVTSLSGTSFQARNLYRCVEVYRRMLQDEQAVIFLGLAGAMVPAGMRKIISDLIRRHYIDVLVSTGANLFHDFFEAIGYRHYVGSPFADDTELRRERVDRIYDTFASDKELAQTEDKIAEIASEFDQRTCSSREFLEHMGAVLEDEESILCTAQKEGVPIFCPALCDSAIGIALTHHYVTTNGDSGLLIDHIRDNFEILQIKHQAGTTGAVYIGGGVPKNYIQQLTPMLTALGIHQGVGHKYFVQLTTDDPKFGGLSGCTAGEAESWGKVTADGIAAMAFVDATIGLPLLAGAVLADNTDQPERANRVFHWERDKLQQITIE